MFADALSFSLGPDGLWSRTSTPASSRGENSVTAPLTVWLHELGALSVARVALHWCDILKRAILSSSRAAIFGTVSGFALGGPTRSHTRSIFDAKISGITVALVLSGTFTPTLTEL